MNTAVAALPPALPENPVPAVSPASLRDFSDRLSPMLVKELRQGMRSPVFVWALIGMNALLTVIVLFMVSDPDGAEVLTAAFWMIIGVVLCVLLPMRGANALSGELRSGAIDCLVLTRLTGWRITLGKWVAVASQQALTAVTVLPYLVVRYFTGGVNLPMEVLALFLLLFGGCAASAVLTGFSWFKHFLLRTLLMLVMLACMVPFCIFITAMMVNPFGRNPLEMLMAADLSQWLLMAVAVLLPAAHIAFTALDSGAEKTGARVENRAILRRLTGLAVMGIYAAAAWLAWKWGSAPGGMSLGSSALLVNPAAFFALMAVTAPVLMLQALGENPVNDAPVLRPFVRRGVAGRFLGRCLLYPGWPSGVRFSLLLAGLFLTGLAIYSLRSGSSSLFNSTRWGLADVIISIFGTLPVPLVLHRWILHRRMKWSTGRALFLLFLTLPVHIVLSLLSHIADSEFLFFPALALPSTGFWMSVTSQDPGHWETHRAFAAFTAAVWWLVAFAFSWHALRETARAERELQKEDAAPAADRGADPVPA